MKTRITILVITILSTCGLLLARNLALRRAVVISLPLATLENADYAIPPGTYRLTLHRWTKTGELVPMLQGVPATPAFPSASGTTSGYRTYILIHPGSRPEHSKGCILTSRQNVELLVHLIQTHENVYVTVAPATVAPQGGSPPCPAVL